MFLFSKPSDADIRTFIEVAAQSELSYSEVGSAERDAPSGYVVDRNRTMIGNGAGRFENAKTALRHWKMFDIPWVRLYWEDAPIEAGQVVAILINHLGFYSLNAARIVYVIDEQNRFGFAYGTLAEHAESGEERFLVEVDPESGNVFYDIFAFSKPNHLLAKLGYPITRRFQKRFAQQSMTAMRRTMTS